MPGRGALANLTASNKHGKVVSRQPVGLALSCGMDYEFTLKYQLASDDAAVEEVVERLGAAGCDDALIGIGQPGRIALEFSRNADSAYAAIVSAMTDVKKAVPTAKLLEVSPDFVGLTDVAELVGVSRQNMRKLSLAHTGSFPAPVHAGSVVLWHLAHVLDWLGPRGAYQIDGAVRDVAHVAMQVNLAKEAAQLESQIRREVRKLVA